MIRPCKITPYEESEEFKLWRADISDQYWYVNGLGEVTLTTEGGCTVDNWNYQSGNYFKTKEEKCVYCSSEEIGGFGCYECGYEKDENGKDTDNIICKFCNTYEQFYNDYYYYNTRYEYYKYISVLSSNGKCYLCNNDLSKKCIKCEIIKNSENTNKVKCTACLPGYYLDSEWNCISFLDKIEKIPNCYRYTFNIANISFYYNDYDYNYEYYYDYYNEIYFNYYNDEKAYYENFSFYNEIFIKMN